MKKQVHQKTQTAPKKNAEDSTIQKLKLIVLLILGAAFVVFSPGLRNEFVTWDDYNYIVNNPVVQSLSIENILHIFHYKTFIMGNYHPLTILSYAVEYKVAGLNPLLYHLNNILLHLLNTALLAYIIWNLSKKYYTTIIATALFAIHPMRVESVVWAAERKDVLYTFFFLFSFIFYLWYITKEEKKNRNYILSLVFFLFSILSKGQAVVLPLTFILIDYWIKRPITKKIVIDKIPFFLLSLAFGLLAMSAQSSSLTAQRLDDYTIFERLLFANYNLVAYLYKLIAPFSLACFYGYPAANEMLKVYVSPFIVLAILTWIIVKHRSNRSIMFGTAFFLFTIFIVIQLLPVGDQIIADRYTYIPYIGLFFIIGNLMQQLIDRNFKWKNNILYASYFIFVLFSVLSFMQSRSWLTTETLWQNTLKNNPIEPIAHSSLGIYYIEKKEYDKGISHITICLEHKDRFKEIFKAYNNLGKAFSETNKPNAAIASFNNALAIAPGFVEARFNRGLTYTDMEKYDSAVVDFTFIVKKLNPNHAPAYYSRGLAWKKAGQLDSAINDYTEAIRISPDYSDALTNRGNVYFNKGIALDADGDKAHAFLLYDKAISDYNTSVKSNANDGNTWMNYSMALYKKGDYVTALKYAQNATNCGKTPDPVYIDILKNGLKK